MKKIKILLLCIVLIVVVSTPVFAAQYGYNVIDEGDFFTPEEFALLEEKLSQFTEETGVGIIFVTREIGSELAHIELQDLPNYFFIEGHYAKQIEPNVYFDTHSGIVITFDNVENAINFQYYGDGKEVFPQSATDAMFEVLANTDTTGDRYTGFNEAADIAINAVNNPAPSPEMLGENANLAGQGLDPLVDGAELFTDDEEQLLIDRIAQIKSEYNFDVTFCTTANLNGQDIMYFADEYPDIDNGADGVVFVVNMDYANDGYDRAYFSSTRNGGIPAFTQQALDRISGEVAPLLSSENYYEAFDEYLNITQDVLTVYASGEVYEKTYYNREDLIFSIVVAAIIAFIIAMIVTGIMKRGMNTAVKKEAAADYIVNGSFVLHSQSDTFLYERTTRSAKAKSSSSGGGGTRSSSGGSRGGGGGRF